MMALMRARGGVGRVAQQAMGRPWPWPSSSPLVAGVVGSPPICQPSRGLKGLMMSQPLLVSTLIEHASRHHGDAEVIKGVSQRMPHRPAA